MLEKRIGPTYWSPQEDLSHNRNTSSKPSKMTRGHIFTHINPWYMDGDYPRTSGGRFKEVHEKTNSDASYTMGQFSTWW